MITHDYTKRYWGHDYTINKVEDDIIFMIGWGNNLKVGDYILLECQFDRHRSTRYKILEIEYYDDPSDMWRGKFEFAPRPIPVGI